MVKENPISRRVPSFFITLCSDDSLYTGITTDFDERFLFPRQGFFLLAGKYYGWNKLKNNFLAELKIAVMIIDIRGIESLKIISLE